MANNIILIFCGFLLSFLTIPANANDYPTDARVDYVFGCMKSNGNSQEILQQCSCSIDTISSLLPYDDYVAAETVARMQQVKGYVGGVFNSTIPSRTIMEKLRRAQAESEIRCFK